MLAHITKIKKLKLEAKAYSKANIKSYNFKR